MNRAHRRAAVAAALAVALVGAACSADEPSSDPGSALPRADEQVLRVAVGQDPFLRAIRPPDRDEATAPELGVGQPDLGLRAGGPNPGIFETLTRATPTFGIAPGLARRWTAGSATRWRFELREGVSFHDGQPLDADAVVATLDVVARREERPRGLEPGSARAVSSHLVEVELSVANERLPEQLANPSLGIQAPGTEAGAGEDPPTTPTGTGPFRFAHYRPGEELRVEANRDYWGEAPQLDEITFVFGEDAAAGQLLATQQVDVVGHIPLALLPQVSGWTDRVAASAPAHSAYLLLNAGGVGDDWGLLADERLRRAVAHAVDPDALVAAAWPHHGTATRTLIPPALLDAAADEIDPPAHDPAAAAELLDAAGWRTGPDGVRERGGQPLELGLLLARPGHLERAAAELEAQLGAVGIATRPLDAGDDPFAPFARVNEATFDLFLDLRPLTDVNPCALCRLFSIRPGGQLIYAGAVHGGAAVDDRFDRAHEAPTVEASRRAAAALVQGVTTDGVVAVPLATLPSVWLLSARVRAFEAAPLPGAQSWAHVHLSL